MDPAILGMDLVTVAIGSERKPKRTVTENTQKLDGRYRALAMDPITLAMGLVALAMYPLTLAVDLVTSVMDPMGVDMDPVICCDRPIDPTYGANDFSHGSSDFPDGAGDFS
jgi:hypothetical protein